MDDKEIVERIGKLAEEEQRLEEAHVGEGLSDDELARKRELEVTLDKMWDLLRQRRAKRSAGQDPDAVEDYFKLGYRGARFAFGYGACPNLEDRTKMVELLEPERIGVTLSEELQLHPEQSTDAFVLHHPEAKYFNV